MKAQDILLKDYVLYCCGCSQLFTFYFYPDVFYDKCPLCGNILYFELEDYHTNEEKYDKRWNS